MSEGGDVAAACEEVKKILASQLDEYKRLTSVEEQKKDDEKYIAEGKTGEKMCVNLWTNHIDQAITSEL